MELIVNFSLRDDQHGRALPIEDLRIRDLFAKQPEEVLDEITDELEGALEKVFETLALTADE